MGSLWYVPTSLCANPGPRAHLRKPSEISAMLSLETVSFVVYILCCASTLPLCKPWGKGASQRGEKETIGTARCCFTRAVHTLCVHTSLFLLGIRAIVSGMVSDCIDAGQECGKFKAIVPPGCTFVLWPIASVASVSMRTTQLNVNTNTKTKDNVTVAVQTAIMYQVTNTGISNSQSLFQKYRLYPQEIINCITPSK